MKPGIVRSMGIVALAAVVLGATVSAQEQSPAPARQPTAIDLVSIDPDGRLYGSDCGGATVFRLDPRGPVVVAGSGVLSYSGDGGPATEAQLFCPFGLAFDERGMFIVDHGNNRLRLVDPAGTISTFAGGGPTGSGVAVLAGDGGPATEARFQEPVGTTIADGVIYVTDRDNNAVRRIGTDGVITMIAGGGGRDGYGGDGGPAVEASLDDPLGVGVDAAGNVLIADSNNGRVRMVDGSGTITTIAGNGDRDSAGDDGPAIEASLVDPQSVAFDSAGNLYVAEAGAARIRRVSPDGIITTFAGTGERSASGDDGPAVDAALGGLDAGIVIDAHDVVSFWSPQARCVRSIGTDGIIRATWCLE